MIVCIAEKPSVGRDIARILGATADHRSYMEGNGYQVTWTFGHLCTLKEPHDYTPAWKAWSLSALPMIPTRFGIKLINEDSIRRQFDVIERLMQAADEIINCGDAGQEGELIQRWVMQKAGASCPVKRLWISSMTDEAIREGFQKLKDQSEYQPLYLAGLSRAIGDWLLGMNATRLYTLKYGQNRQVLSIGRVQTPTLALVVNRQHEIDNFQPEPYWVLATIYRDTTFTAVVDEADEEKEANTQQPAANDQQPTANSRIPRNSYTSVEEGQKAFQTIEGKPFTVNSVTKKNGKELPPNLFDLTSLQVECNKKFGYSAEMTLNLIQTLYERKYTTYPRVDTQYLPDDVYPQCPNIMNGLYKTIRNGQAPYADLVRPLGGGKALRKDKKFFDTSKVTDHHAIIPTGVPPQGLNDAEQHVYDLIARRFIAAFYPDCKYATTTVLGSVDNIKFKATGKEILEPGWRVVMAAAAAGTADDGKDANGEQGILPTFVKGESGPHQPTLTEKQTTPPPYYTEATLLRAMETAGRFVDDEELRAALKENGIGRPSSRAGIIETLFKRNYIRRERKRLVATPTGIELIGLIREELLKSCELTGIWEKKLRDIEHRTYDAQQFISELKEQITQIVNDVMRDTSNRRISIEIPTAKKAKNAKAKSQQPTAKSQQPTPNPQQPTANTQQPTPNGQQPTSNPQQPTPNSQQPTANSQQPTANAQQPTSKEVCPLCGKGYIIRGRTAYGCSEWRNGCTFRRPLEE
jgi:DNA topoisomerase-3